MPEFWKDITLEAFPLIAMFKFILSHPLNRGRPLSTLARFVTWQVASRLRAEIEFEWIEGAKLIVSRGMTGATGNIYCGLHEFVEMGFLLHLLRPNDLFLDVGANIGSYTILAASVCRARAIAFEPDPHAARVLRRNIAINHLSALADVREAALGGVRGQIVFTVGLDTMDDNAQAQPRLLHLGYPSYASPTNNLKEFQMDYGLAVTGNLTPETKSKLWEVHDECQPKAFDESGQASPNSNAP